MSAASGAGAAAGGGDAGPGAGGIAGELSRYREMLEPLAALPSGGMGEIGPEERPAFEAALQTLRGYHGDHLELEEAVAAFARALWSAPGWSEPPARIAEALLVRSKRWPEAPRAQAVALARAFAERAFTLEPGSATARIAYARSRLAAGDLEEADRAARLLPSEHAPALALRSEVAEARGRIDEAITERSAQLALESDAAAIRDARNKLALLHQAAGRLDQAIAVHRDNLARHPDYAWGRVNLGAALEARRDVLEAYAEVETAVLLGLEEARPYLDELGAALDRRSLERFRRLLLTGRDGDALELCPSGAGPAAAPPASPSPPGTGGAAT